MRRLTLSTAVKAPKVLSMPSMTICGLASGSSHGLSASDFGWVDGTRLELGRRSRAAPGRRKKRPLHHLGSRHSALPYEFAVEIDIRPDRRARPEVRCIDHSKRDVALASRRPRRRGDAADLTPAVRARVQQRMVRRLVSGDVESHQPPPRAPPPLREKRAPAVEMSLVKIDQPCKAQLQRRAIAAGSQRMLRG